MSDQGNTVEISPMKHFGKAILSLDPCESTKNWYLSVAESLAPKAGDEIFRHPVQSAEAPNK